MNSIDTRWRHFTDRDRPCLFIRVGDEVDGGQVDLWLGNPPGAETMLASVFGCIRAGRPAAHHARALKLAGTIRIRPDLAATIEGKADPFHWLSREASTGELVETSA